MADPLGEKNPLLEVSGSLAALILKRRFEQGEEISIPSLGLTIKKDRGSGETEKQGNDEAPD